MLKRWLHTIFPVQLIATCHIRSHVMHQLWPTMCWCHRCICSYSRGKVHNKRLRRLRMYDYIRRFPGIFPRQRAYAHHLKPPPTLHVNTTCRSCVNSYACEVNACDFILDTHRRMWYCTISMHQVYLPAGALLTVRAPCIAGGVSSGGWHMGTLMPTTFL